MSQPQQSPVKRVRIGDFADAKRNGRKLALLTSYDFLTAKVFDQSGIDALLVGDSAGNNVLGYPSTLPITVDELISFSRAVVKGVKRTLVVADLPFGSYEGSPEQALNTAIRFMKEAQVHAVKLEGGIRVAEHIRALTQAGIPVMGHVGFTPQSEHNLGGYKVQGRGDKAARLLEDARAVEEAGAFSVVLEMVPGPIASDVSQELHIPTIGIGAGPHTDGQILVWTDMAGLNTGTVPRFVKQYTQIAENLTDAATAYIEEVRSGAFPAAQHTFDS